MAKTKQQKEQSLQVLVDGIKNSKSVVFANFQGLKVLESEELRSICREQNITYVASKKTLLKKALTDAGYDIDTKAYEGGVAVVFGNEDEVAPAQTVAKFAKTHKVVSVFGGLLEGKYIDAVKVTELSQLPNKQQMLGQLVGTLNAPISGFVNVLAGNLRGLVNVLNGIKESKV
ncbi:MAG: 50S ribosomal protein L10 [Candidatus Magasanikbacteria bacterium RIFCSPHIGHO2_01_FULL_33_34]|uniref:Large ribosomal subunit protein uL10 n=1 Tax=Candidatus Magasanikbacteria bacterium RIFCSPHIGHO2_01_FULL_33_34 TaxID=1798671 RepID=A0A1F6LJ56_9BACT|nr:MAG: 50S ribosomal protein L10 [Candidatus Magasanikbacteria bacterium RIFCSPHIGHO2_01_FULL_33_34]OGH65310.1 MAG: 50S ribosomal protein L10 [Candidatus Magasanikbacteria bacterium RIFCSPHIGHO2_02_FULL_33_17]OGH76087.1 MAG: 50S ribosomal protein L10 [Candidatus Magasanikbacteria bacterium RIFCSPLOWO2_01_FULL_33_34]OGH81742.1 MAG: 50S ribosomal protein L10 [Candidatus Magasanikbacteria bacterium RIFCSPLOWO2_12_FULL_34_7]